MFLYIAKGKEFLTIFVVTCKKVRQSKHNANRRWPEIHQTNYQCHFQ